MLNLIIGGSASGKSAFAEELVCRQEKPRIYLATMIASDDDSHARILRHRAAREGRGFETLERGLDLSGASVPDESSVLLEDLSNLLANELFCPEGGGVEAVRRGLLHVEHQCRSLTVVTNEVFSGGTGYAGETLAYMKALAQLNRELAERAAMSVEVVCGLPNVLKGDLPWHC